MKFAPMQNPLTDQRIPLYRPDLSGNEKKYVLDCIDSTWISSIGEYRGTFFGNKTITTGEGGAVIATDPALSQRLRIVKGQGQSLTRRYWHEELGFNYRMTNIAAAIGFAQSERLPQILARKRTVAKRYHALLSDRPVTFQKPDAGVASSEWLTSVLLPRGCNRDRLMAEMAEQQVETRPVFSCAHHMPIYAGRAASVHTPVAEDIAARGISLPSYPTLTEAGQQRVVSAFNAALAAQELGR